MRNANTGSEENAVNENKDNAISFIIKERYKLCSLIKSYMYKI